jgi:hypothetical protein
LEALTFIFPCVYLSDGEHTQHQRQRCALGAAWSGEHNIFSGLELALEFLLSTESISSLAGQTPIFQPGNIGTSR